MLGLLSPILMVTYGLFYGLTMKIADLLDEHGLKLFKGSAIIFGFIWGVFGSLLVIGNNDLANIILAMNLAFIIRNRLDYLNHQIASSIIILTFLLTATFLPIKFFIFYITFLIFGGLRDWIGDSIKNKNRLHLIYDQVMWYYPIPTFIYSYLYNDWVVFFVFLSYTIGYDGIKYYFRRKGYL